jgi:hypothetical protein
MVNATFVVMKMTIRFHVAKKNKGGGHQKKRIKVERERIIEKLRNVRRR